MEKNRKESQNLQIQKENRQRMLHGNDSFDDRRRKCNFSRDIEELVRRDQVDLLVNGPDRPQIS